MSVTPKSFLGEITALTIATPDIDASFACYKKLGFTEVFRADWPFPWMQVSDGVLLIMLRKDPQPYLALTYYVKDLDKVVSLLGKKGIEFVQKPKKTDQVRRYLFLSPDGLNISLVGIVDGFAQPPGPGMLAMLPEDYFKPEKYVNKTIGLFGELAHRVKDLKASLAYWALLGFKAVSKFEHPYPWAIVSDGLSIVGLHQSAHFSYPAITYFAADMKLKIDRLKKAGLTNFTQKNDVDVVLTMPEQQHIFLFNMGMPAAAKPTAITLHTLETKRLLLKELNPEVLRQIYSTCTDDEAMKLVGVATKEQLDAERAKFENGMTTYRTSFKTFVLIEKATGNAIGKCGFHNWYAMHSRAEFGYLMEDESARGKGLMTEAARAVIAHGFEAMGLNRIEAFVGPQNVPSLKIVTGCGFVQEGVLRSHFCRDGIMEDSVIFSLLANEYEQVKLLWKDK